MSNREMATWLAREIFKIGDDGPARQAVRLQYMTGSLTNERAGGGVIEPSLVNFLEHLLDRYEKRTAQETSAKCAHQHPDRQPTDTYCRDCGEPLETFFAPVGRPMPLTHWSKDPLVPYADCKCQTCAYARGDLQFTTTDSTTQNRGV